MDERRNTKDLIHFYIEEFKEHFKEYQIKKIDDNTLAISTNGEAWNVIKFGATWCVDRDTKQGFQPKFNPDTCYDHKKYLKMLELKAKKEAFLQKN